MKKGDLLIILILAVSVISWFGINKLSELKDDRQIVIETNGNVYKVISIETGMKQQDIHIELGDGKHIDIVVDENGAYVKIIVLNIHFNKTRINFGNIN